MTSTFTKIVAYYLLHPNNTLITKGSKQSSELVLPEPLSPNCTLLVYCLMPNHFHFMLRQEDSDLTISDFMRRISITYAMYFNHKYKHSGAIFQGKYKNVLLTNEYHWLYLSKYIHRNPLHLQKNKVPNLVLYPYSSYLNYLNVKTERWLNTSTLLNNNEQDPIGNYQRFVEDGGDSGDIEKLTLDVDELQY
jgi:REP element-mobilizing transposase RayT